MAPIIEVTEGEIFGLLGPNGAGKTTIVECLQGLRQADGGQIRVLGLDPQTDKPSLRRQIGSQLQESALPDRIQVWEVLELFSSFAKGSRDWKVLMEQWGLRQRHGPAGNYPAKQGFGDGDSGDQPELKNRPDLLTF